MKIKDLLSRLKEGVYRFQLKGKDIYVFMPEKKHAQCENLYSFSHEPDGFKIHLLEVDDNTVVVKEVGKSGNFKKPVTLSSTDLKFIEIFR